MKKLVSILLALVSIMMLAVPGFASALPAETPVARITENYEIPRTSTDSYDVGRAALGDSSLVQVDLGDVRFDLSFITSFRDNGTLEYLDCYVKKLTSDNQEYANYINQGKQVLFFQNSSSYRMLSWQSSLNYSHFKITSRDNLSEEYQNNPNVLATHLLPGTHTITVKLNDGITEIGKFKVIVPENIFTKKYDKLFVKRSYNTSGEKNAELEFYGNGSSANIDNSVNYKIQTSLGSSPSYNSAVLPDYDAVKKVPTGLVVKGFFYYDADGTRHDVKSGDIALSNVNYYADMAIDFSNFQNIFNGIINYIMWRIMLSIM